MRLRKRALWIGAGSLVALILMLALAAVLVLQSGWFHEKVRARIVAEIEKATGGRTEIRSFRFDWKRLRAEVEGLTLHGTEPAGAPPLFRAQSIAVDLKIVSALERKVDIQSLEVSRPRVYLVVYPDGRTNVPAPKIRRARRSTIETILDLAIGRFQLRDGDFEVAGRSRTPFEARGRDLRALFTYDRAGPLYGGNITLKSADFQWGAYRPVPLDLNVTLEMERNRLRIDSARVAAGQSAAEFSGAIESLVQFTGSLRYQARIALADVVRTLELRTRLEGPVTVSGNLRFSGTSDYAGTGSFHASGLLFRPDPHFTLRNFDADGALSVDPKRLRVNGMRLSGVALAALTGTPPKLQPIPVNGRIEAVELRGRNVEASGIHVSQLGGSFAGSARIADFQHVTVQGDVAGFDVRQMMSVYNGQSVPWDAIASGPVELKASLKHSDALHLDAHMAISPAETGAPVRGAIDAVYDGASRTLDLGRSNLALPSTHVEFSGILGQRLEVRADSRNLDDVLPAFNVPSLPVKLRNGQAKFEGLVTGKLDDPHISGHGAAENLEWSGRIFQALSGDVDLTRSGLTLRNGSVRHADVRLLGSGSLGMQDWKIDQTSPISGSGTIRDASVAGLLAVAGVNDVPVEGTVNAEGRVSGTFGDPKIAAGFSVVKGAIGGEPFDRFSGTLAYGNRALELAKGELTAGGKQIAVAANYIHAADNLGSGRLRFQVESNPMPLDQFTVVNRQFPAIHGVAEIHLAGSMQIQPAKSGEPGIRLTDLNGSLAARGLRVNEQPVRDVNLTAATKGREIVAHLNSEVAGSVVSGEGKWTLTDDYPGTAQIDFTGLDLARLQSWLSRGKPAGRIELVGLARGTLTFTGPAVKPEMWKAVLRIPTLQVGPGSALGPGGKILALHNPGPIVVSMERRVVKIESARLVGRATDLSLSGTVSLWQKNPLDLRVAGSFDLATLQDFNRDIYSEGTMQTGATIRGALDHPSINGSFDIKEATFNLADSPVGIYKVNGKVLFDGSRATIQTLSGESGGGRISLSGFADFSGPSVVFRIHANAREVRVRYPVDFSTVGTASLNLTGSTDSSLLAGRVTVLRTGFNPRSDFSSLLAKSAEPVRTPSSQAGLLANMHFDVQIETAPDITFQSSLAQGLQAEASLRLRGTGANPSLLGRINVTQGQITFFGTQFIISQGTIAFYNPVKIEPVLNVDLETKARGIEVTLNVSGPMNKLNLTPRSDPPMPFPDILALLATGRSPGSEYSTLMASPASPQSVQQLGASALLGQAIASPVTGRLQRFFGVTRLKIDPTLSSLSGVINNPEARLTIEQQVTPDITFTYVTDVTSSNPLMVQVEWAMNRNWSAVAVREENGLLGLNFLYKRRF